MDYFKIPKDYKSVLEPFFKKNFPGRKYLFSLNHHYDNRYIILSTCLDNLDIHYELYQGFVELHLEGAYSTSDYAEVWKALVEASEKYPELTWHRWVNRNQGRCRYNRCIKSTQDVMEAYLKMSEIFDPVLEPFKDAKVDTDEDMDVPDLIPMKDDHLTYEVVRILDIPFDNLRIPEYQRPYKWNAKNVNQLINDILVFKECKEYRLGTLVLNNNDIVDGQQRIVTLSLILHVLFNKREIADSKVYQDIMNKISIFFRRTKFKNAYSIANVRDNIAAINDRLEDLDEDFMRFLLNNCQFVVVRLPEISEAFQFFDSQNARGKDLEPHDLLKAFHLREIDKMSEMDSRNITLWQDLKTEHLADLFLALYRVKRWVKSKRAKEFTKKNIDTFKGISLHDQWYPYYMQQVICNYFMEVYNHDVTRKIDRSTMEFPYQLDQICINGSRFFDMIKHYDGLYSKLISSKVFKEYDSERDERTAYKIVRVLNSYPNRNRKGDIYTRQLFNCLLTYYVDRFGFENINKVVRKIFRYTYRVRLEKFSVQLSTIDNEAKEGAMFRCIRDAKSSYDVINLEIPEIVNYASNADKNILAIY